MPLEKCPQSPVICEQRGLIPNEHGEKLVGLLHQTRSKKLVILCHGFRATKDDSILVDLADAITKEGISAFRFDFSGNGESDGEFQYGSYRKEAADLRSVVLHFSEQKYDIIALIGHSKGGNAVLLYASKYHDVPIIVNISGRFALERGIEGRLGKNFMRRINKDGYIDVKNRKGELEYRVATASLEDRLSTDTLFSSRAICEDCRVLTIHGAKDEIVPAEDAPRAAHHRGGQPPLHRTLGGAGLAGAGLPQVPSPPGHVALASETVEHTHLTLCPLRTDLEGEGGKFPLFQSKSVEMVCAIWMCSSRTRIRVARTFAVQIRVTLEFKKRKSVPGI